MRKILFNSLYVLVLMLVLSGCEKDKMPPGNASLSIYNVIPGDTLLANFDSKKPSSWFELLLKLNYNDSIDGLASFRSYTRSQELAIYRISDTLPGKEPYLHLTLSLPEGSINSLFITGTSGAPDTLLTVDTHPFYSSKDSVAGFRFINLSPGSAPVSVNTKGKPAGSTIASLPYKGVTEYLTWPATHDVNTITFEFRDAASGTLLYTYNAVGVNNDNSDLSKRINKWRFRNATLALTGLPNGTGKMAQTIFPITNSLPQ